MNVYTCVGFEGRWPVGTAAVVVASTEAEACTLLSSALVEHGLKKQLEFDIYKLDLTTAKAYILNDGEY